MKFKNKYRIESARLHSWDYTAPGWYFVTVCTKNKENFFGDVIDGEMNLSKAGRIVSEEWLKTAIIRSNIMLDEWVIMPNHLHGILVITERMTNVETRASLQDQNGSPAHWGQSSTNLNQYQRNESVVQEHQRSPGSLDSLTTSSGMRMPCPAFEPTYKTIRRNGNLINITAESVASSPNSG